MKKLTVWVCGFCDTSSRYKSYMEKHEIECKYNPINKRCHSCSNFIEPNFNIGASPCNIKKNSFYYDNSGEICESWTPNSLTLLRELKIKRLKMLKDKNKKYGKMWF